MQVGDRVFWVWTVDSHVNWYQVWVGTVSAISEGPAHRRNVRLQGLTLAKGERSTKEREPPLDNVLTGMVNLRLTLDAAVEEIRRRCTAHLSQLTATRVSTEEHLKKLQEGLRHLQMVREESEWRWCGWGVETPEEASDGDESKRTESKPDAKPDEPGSGDAVGGRWVVR